MDEQYREGKSFAAQKELYGEINNKELDKMINPALEVAERVGCTDVDVLRHAFTLATEPETTNRVRRVLAFVEQELGLTLPADKRAMGSLFESCAYWVRESA